MKRIAKALVIVALASTATVASAAFNQYGNPISGDDPYPTSGPYYRGMAGEFPNMKTYKQEHRNDRVPQSQTAAPSDNPGTQG